MRSNLGQQAYTDVKEFGLPGVDSAADLTRTQSLFMTEAWVERQEMIFGD